MSDPSRRTGLMLLAHGSRDPAWRAPLEALAARVAAETPGTPVAIAWMQHAQPSADQVIADLVDQGCTDVRVLPLLISAGNHLRTDLPRIEASLRDQAPGVRLEVLPALAELPAFATLLHDIARRAASAGPPAVQLSFVERGDPRFVGQLDLRYRILRVPLGMPPGSEVYAHEDDCLHLVACVEASATVVGCVIFHPDGAGGGRLLQMAVDPTLHGRGVGRQLVEALEAELVERGVRSVVLHARHHAVGFYERLGYVCFGAPYDEVGMPHRTMRRDLGEG